MIIGIPAAVFGGMSLLKGHKAEAAVVPIPTYLTPKCALVTDKDSFGLGDSIRFYWLSSNTAYAVFVSDPMSAGNLQVPAGTFGHSGTVSLVALNPGSASLTLSVYNSAGQSATCTKTVQVSH